MPSDESVSPLTILQQKKNLSTDDTQSSHASFFPVDLAASSISMFIDILLLPPPSYLDSC